MKLTQLETDALIIFWRKYMVARKYYEKLLRDAKLGGKPCGCSEWIAYSETKQDAFNELVLTISEIRYYSPTSPNENAGGGFWRDVTMLRPEAVVDGIIRYRKVKQAEREQREAEKAILTAQALKPIKKGKHGRRNKK